MNGDPREDRKRKGGGTKNTLKEGGQRESGGTKRIKG